MTVDRRFYQLPEGPVELEWHADAACRGSDPDDWFPQIKERPDRDGPSVRALKAVCAECEVRQKCLDYALDRPERDGVFGGLTHFERNDILRARRAKRRRAG